MIYLMTDVEAILAFLPEPSIYLKTPSIPGIHGYSASKFLDCAARGGQFAIGPSFDDQDPVFISEIEVSDFAKWIRSKIPPAMGKFKTVWIESDPTLPF